MKDFFGMSGSFHFNNNISARRPSGIADVKKGGTLWKHIRISDQEPNSERGLLH
jgi:hypothetical protein